MKSFGWCSVLLGHFFIAGLVSSQAQSSIDAALLPLTPEVSTVAGEGGYPAFVDHFSPRDYGAQAQNWAVTQDKHGLIYAANYDGILQYDGQRWQLIRTPTNAIARSLTTDEEGTVYVGAEGDFGYLAADSSGGLQFSSLLAHLPSDTLSLGDVWGVHALPQGIYFQTWKRLIEWDGKAMRVWTTDSFFHTSFSVHHRLFVNELRVGLQEVRGDSLVLIPGGDQFAAASVYAMLPLDEEDVLIVTRDNGLYRLTPEGITGFSSVARSFLDENRVYDGTRLSDGSFAIATQNGGIALLDEAGTLLNVLNTNNVLPDDVVNSVFVDKQGGLWAALDSQGLVRLDLPSSLTRFQDTRGLQGSISQVVRHKQTLYVGTRTGLFILQPSDQDAYDHFQPFPGIDAAVWTFAVRGEDLFIGTSEGIFVLQNDRLQKLSSRWAYVLHASVFHEDLLYVGGPDAIFRLQRSESQWVETTMAQVGKPIWSIAETDPQTLWLGSSSSGVIRVDKASTAGELPSVTSFGEAEGLDNTRVDIYVWEGQPLFVSQNSVFRYQPLPSGEGTSVFQPANDFIESFDVAQGDSLQSFVQTSSGTIWASFNDHVLIAKPQADGSYVREQPPVLHFPKLASTLYVEERGVAWISNNDELYRYDPQVDKRYDTSFPALIRRTEVLGLGRPLYSGAASHLLVAQDIAIPATLDYDFNDIRFDVAATSYNNPQDTRFQYYLEGQDHQWSQWTTATQRLYPNLSEGDYRLRVRAQNAQGVVSQEASFTFEVLPPWYRTAWAYAAYVLIILFVGVSTWRFQKVVQENKEAHLHAAALARERKANEQLVEANTRLQEANARLTEVNALKDELIASVSHELRTPLTAILGFASVLKEEVDSGEHKEFLQIIHDNGNRLLSTLDGLLDLAKLRAGMMEVHAEVIHVGDEAREVIRLLEHLAHRKKIDLRLASTAEPLYAALDRHLYERILFNLVGNAIKFTEEGEVVVDVSRHEDCVQVEVQDTGIGISKDFLPQLFEPFKQESSGFARTHEGSGLGLTLTAELVELMHGTIRVDSEKGRGSTFTVTFPLYQHPMEEPALA